MNADDESLVMRYLLGDLSGEERTVLDQRFLVESELLECSEALEDQLIRDALRGELPPDQQARFENHFLSFPELRRKYELTQAMIVVAGVGAPGPAIAAIPPLSKPAFYKWNVWKLVAIAAGVAIVILAWQYLSLRSTLRYREEAIRGLELKDADRHALTLSFVLAPGLERRQDSKPRRLQIPAAARAVRLQLDFETSVQHSVYAAVLRAVDGDREVWGQGSLAAGQSAGLRNVVLEIPAAALAVGDYVLTLNTADTGRPQLVESYSFGVVRPPE
jgi:hypothetical protein